MSEEQTSRSLRGMSVGVALLAFVALIWLLNFAQSVLIPLLVAVIVWTVINALSDALRAVGVGRFRLPQWLTMTISIVISLSTLYFVGDIIAASAQEMAENGERYQRNIESILPQVTQLFNMEPATNLRDFVDQIDIGAFIGNVALAVSSLLGNAIIVLIYVGFLIAEQGTFNQKINAMFRNPQRREEMRAIGKLLAAQVQNYLSVKTLMSLLTAVLSYGVMRYIGLEFAEFWAFIIFLLNYVPTIGSTLGVIFPALQTLVQFGVDDPTNLIIVIVALGLVPQFLVGNVLEPKVMGTSLNLSPLVIIGSLAFWGFLWGIPGLFLSVPIMVIIMIISAHFDATRWIAVMLSADGEIVKAMREDRPQPGL